MTKSAEGTQVILTGCTQDCGGRCPLKVHVKDGRVIRIEGDDGEEPQYRACLRGRAQRQRLYAPDRLKFPMKRVGVRGEGKFERVSWDEALDKVASELKRIKQSYGPAAIFFGGGGSNAVFHGVKAGSRLLGMFGGYTRPFGNVSNGCSISASMSCYGTMAGTGNTRDDLVNSRLIIMWAWNPAHTIWDTNTNFHLIQAKEAGAKIIVIDPQFTDSAAIFADEWIPIIPGTDTAMMVAMANVMIKENLHDKEFLDKYTIGFEKFKDYVLGVEDGVEKTPAWAQAITGVAASVIEGLAREYATRKPAALIAGWGPGRTAYGEQYHRAAITLTAMTGNVGIHGGNAAGWESSYPSYRGLGGMPGVQNAVEIGVPLRKGTLPWPGGSYPSSARVHTCLLWDTILQGKAGGYHSDIKMAYLGGGSLDQHPDVNKGVEALKKLEFIVVHELFMTATARFADILLPVNTMFERNDMAAPWLSAPYYVCVNKAVESLYESKTDFEIFTELAPRLGILDFGDKTEVEWLRDIANTAKDIPNYEEFKQKGIHKIQLAEPYVAFKKQIEDPENNPFHTPSGKIEIFSQRLADLNIPGTPGIPQYIETWESRNDPLSRKYPLQFTSTHFKRRVHSQLDNIPWLKELEPHALWINTSDAEARGISDGQMVRVFNDRGETIILAKVTERIMPGVVNMPEGGGYAPDERGIDRGGSANILTKQGSTPEGGSHINTCLVQVEKA